MTEEERGIIMREYSRKPVHITKQGRVFIDNHEILFPIIQDSIKVEQTRNGRHNLLTLTIFVGDVQIDIKPPEPQDHE